MYKGGYDLLNVLIIFIFIVLMLIITLCISQRNQINKITEQLDNDEHIRVSLNNYSIENLANSINNKLSNYKKEQINMYNREEKLKESIANISHDLRTPLTSIQGYLTLLEECSDKDKERYLNIIRLKANSLEKLIKDFYEISILDDNKFTIETYQLDINSIITEILISNYSAFEESGITPTLNIPNEALMVIGEHLACERIIQNLITNAIKYSAGEINITVTVSKGETIFTVSNSVKDINEVEVANLFDRFYVGEKSRCNGGTGLGLFIVKILLEKIGGRITDVYLENNKINIAIAFRN